MAKVMSVVRSLSAVFRLRLSAASPFTVHGDACHRQRGAVSLEFAATLPLLLAFVLAFVGVIAAAHDQIRVQHAAREGARAAALGEGQDQAAKTTRDLLPRPGQATVRVDEPVPGRVRVRVELPVELFLGPTVTARAETVTVLEPGATLTGPADAD